MTISSKHLKINYIRWLKIAFVLLSLLTNLWAIYVMLPSNCQIYLSTCPEIPIDIIPIIVSFGFLYVSVTTLFDDSNLVSTTFFSLSSLIFTTGLTGGLGSGFGFVLFYLILAWLAPILFQFNTSWSPLHKEKLSKFIILLLYILTLFFSVFMFLHALKISEPNWLHSIVNNGVRIEFVLAVLLVIIYFIVFLKRGSDESAKYRIRLIFVGFILALSPLILFSVIPYLLGFYYIPTEASFLFLLFIPLTYDSSIHSERYQWLGNRVNKVIYYYLLSILVVSGYLFLVQLISRFIPTWEHFWAWVCSAICIFFILVLNRANQAVKRIINWILHGNEEYYLELISKMSNSLGLVLNHTVLYKMLVDDLVEIMHLSACALFLKKDKGFYLFSKSGYEFNSKEIFIPDNCEFIKYLIQTKTVIDDHLLHKIIKTYPTNLNELIQTKNIKFWIPLISGEELYGLLVIGHFPHDDFISENERQALQVFAHQAGVASHNVQLMEELRNKSDELAHAHQQLLFSREHESLKIANKLHDNSIQELLGISYQLAKIKNNVNSSNGKGENSNDTLFSELDSVREKILNTSSELRDVVGELQPAGLSEFGLSKAIEGYIYKIRNNSVQEIPQIRLTSIENDTEIDNEIAICLFRVTQEAIRNSLKHANAKSIEITINLTEARIILMVTDDGSGFEIPEWQNKLTKTNHFGLLGMTERVSWVGGEISIQSTIGKGTKVIASVPLNRRLS